MNAPDSTSPAQLIPILRGIAGAIAGGVVGYLGFKWMASQGFYAMVLPGSALGLGCGYASRIRSPLLGGLCAILAIGLGLLCEALVMPFVADNSLSFFFANLSELSTATILLIAVGAAMSYWFGIGRARS